MLLSRISPGLAARLVDPNSASRIIANRPYANEAALVRRGVIGEGKFERIENVGRSSRGARQAGDAPSD
jgi:hypothetical protein